MAASANELITDALLHAQIGDVYNDLDANNVEFSLRCLNDMIDSWSTEELTIFDILEGTFNLISGQNHYLLGPSDNLGVRPTIVNDLTIVSADQINYPVQIIGVDQWSKIIYWPAPGRPEVAYMDGNVPAEGMYLWPTPSFANDVMHVWYSTVIPSFTTLTQTLVAPPGYTLAIKMQLGIILANAYGQDVPPGLEKRAWKAMNNARRENGQPKVLVTDIPFIGHRRYNIFYDGV